MLAGTVTNGETLILRSQAPLIGHTQWVAKAVDEAKRSGQGLVLLTPSTSKITRALAHLFDVLGVMWVVDDGRGALFVGTTGQVVTHRAGNFFASDALYEGFSRRGSAQERGGVWVKAETLKPRREKTVAGDLAQAVSMALTGRAPAGWGIQEPVTEPWSVTDITARYASDPAPGHFLHFVAPPCAGLAPATGTIEIQKPRNGVVEHVEAAAELPEPWNADERIDFARRMHAARIRWATVFHLVGELPTVVRPSYLGLPVPSILVFGAEAIAGRDANELGELALMHGAARYEVLDSDAPTGLGILLQDEPRPGFPAPAQTMEAVYRELMPTWPTL